MTHPINGTQTTLNCHLYPQVSFSFDFLLTKKCSLGLLNLMLEFSKGTKVFRDISASLLVRLD